MIATIILLCLTSGSLMLSLVNHGESKGNYHFGYTFFAVIINMILYFYAGLFDKF